MIEESCVPAYPDLGAAWTSSLLSNCALLAGAGLAPVALAWLQGCFKPGTRSWLGSENSPNSAWCVLAVCGTTGALALVVSTIDSIISLEIASSQPSRGYSFDIRLLRIAEVNIGDGVDS